MQQITRRAYPRAALIGNPSDGYHGKTIAFVFDNFFAEVSLEPSKQLEIIDSDVHFDSLQDLISHTDRYGYYGVRRLISAGLKRFYNYVLRKKLHVDPSAAFTIRSVSTIPRALGLGGSSAIITALFKALCAYFGIDIRKEHMAQLILDTELKELHIGAGLQDRVVQSYACPMYMDFDKDYMARHGFGKYESMDLKGMPRCYIAYSKTAAQSSGLTHNDLRSRYEQGQHDVVEAMSQFSSYTDKFREALSSEDKQLMDHLINANFDLRQSIMTLSKKQIDMIHAAREVGASAKFTGSGGAIIGLIDEGSYDRLESKMHDLGAKVFIPNIVGQ